MSQQRTRQYHRHSPRDNQRENIRIAQSMIPISSLPRTFLDAAAIARSLSQRYLWIDSLCIIQDSKSDWAHESSRMGSVYGNAIFNIAATASSHCQEGCYRPENPSKSSSDPGNTLLPLRIRRHWGGSQFSGDFLVCDFQRWWDGFERAPLNRRAWVLQERLLAPRVLHFGLDMMVFECAAGMACERFPYGLPRWVDGLARRPELKKVMGQWALGVTVSEAGDNEGDKDGDQTGDAARGQKDAEDQEGNGGARGFLAIQIDDILQRWNDVVRDFSDAELTFESDRLIALTGIIDQFIPAFQSIQKNSSSSGDVFVASLWMPDIEKQLAWRVVSDTENQQWSVRAPGGRRGRRSQLYMGPSWSWTSVLQAKVEPQSGMPGFSLVEVVSMDIVAQPDAKSAVGVLKYHCSPGTSMRLRCALVPLTGLGDPRGMSFYPGSHWKGRSDGQGSEDMVYIRSLNYFDVPFREEAGVAKALCCMPVFVDTARVSPPLHGLILEQTEELGADGSVKRYYVRRGVFVLTRDVDTTTFWSCCHDFDNGVFAPQHELRPVWLGEDATDNHKYSMQRAGLTQHEINLR